MHWSLYSPIIKDGSPLNKDKPMMKNGWRTLFKENNSPKDEDADELECKSNILSQTQFFIAVDTQWVIDLIENDNNSPEK